MTKHESECVLITVKTYPTLSTKYGETVCTAGIREDGSWVRIYPVPFRGLDEVQQYKKYDWVDCKLIRRTRDPRPESFSPDDRVGIRPVTHVDTSSRWRERRRLLLGEGRVFDELERLITDAKNNVRSLAIFKPAKIVDFSWEREEREWDKGKLAKMRARHSQLDLFDDESWNNKIFDVIPKLPNSFHYKFIDVTGRSSELILLDWEVGALYWNCLRSSANETEALEKVRQKYFDSFLKTDLHFYLGTTQQFHQVAPNPWVIIGVLPIPHDPQGELFHAR